MPSYQLSQSQNVLKNVDHFSCSSWMINKCTIFWQSVVPFYEKEKEDEERIPFHFILLFIRLFFCTTTEKKDAEARKLDVVYYYHLQGTNILHQLILYAFFSVICHSFSFGLASMQHVCVCAFVCAGVDARRIVPVVASFVSVKAIIVFGLTLTANWRKTIIKNELKEQILRMNKKNEKFEWNSSYWCCNLLCDNDYDLWNIDWTNTCFHP